MKHILIILSLILLFTPTVFGQERGYRDFKFGMKYNEIQKLAEKICLWKIFNYGTECYKIGGKKRDMIFVFSNIMGGYLVGIELILDQYTPSYFNKVANALGKKYKETYRLSSQQKNYLNYGNMIIYYDDARVTLTHRKLTPDTDEVVIIIYSYEENSTYKKFSPKDVSSDDF